MTARGRRLDGERELAARVAVIIPTVDRPEPLRSALASLADQTRPPDEVVVVDAGATAESGKVCSEFAERLPALVRIPSDRGLTKQRRTGIAFARRDDRVQYICFLDDDVILSQGFLATIIDYLESSEGQGYGGMSGYDLESWGTDAYRSERLYHRLKLFDGELRAGRWLYNGYFLDLQHIQPYSGVVECEFLPGAFTVWRTTVFDRFLPPIEMTGYALGEDKHLSLRVGTEFPMAVHTGAKVRHIRAPLGRPGEIRMAYEYMRMQALLLRDCDPKPSLRRYLVFLAFQPINIALATADAILRARLRNVRRSMGWLLGWLSCVVAPPRPTRDRLPAARSGATLRQEIS